MRVSWNWLSELVDLTGLDGPADLAQILTNRGLEVEEIEKQDHGLGKVVSAKILEKNRHPQADRLSLCKVSLGAGEPLDIVCGAQNMKAGDIVALAQIGAELPNGMKIAQGKIRGEVSNGMLCSEDELRLPKTPGLDGIIILPPDTKLGQPIAQVLGRNDTILVFKLTANRGDCLSHFGMAREVAAALDKTAKKPAAKILEFKGSPIGVALEAGAEAPQFYGAYIDGVKVGPSPAWLVKRLEALGSRAINNVVDATNLVMLENGHPVHAYDADRIEGKKIGVRLAKDQEALPLLDGTEIKLKGTELVIFDAGRAIGLAGVMGGGNSEVQNSTTRLFLECAQFSSSRVRKVSTLHQKKTDASHRFERGVDPENLAYVISRLATLVTELAGGKVQGAIEAKLPTSAWAIKKIRVAPAYFPKFLGMKVDADQAEKILKGLDCQIEKKGSDWEVTPPSYRLDLTLPEDLAEEIARTLGYDQIESTMPVLSSSPTPPSASASANQLALIEKAKQALVQAGITESLNLGFTSKAWLAKFGLTGTVNILNPLSEELEVMVPSLIPGLVKNALDNWHHHFGSESLAIRLFELRPTFHSASAIKAKGEMDTGVTESWRLSLVLSGPKYAGALLNENPNVDFFDLKAVIESILEALGARGIRFQAPKTPHPQLAHFHPGQSVEVLAGKDVAGHFGLLHPLLARELKLRGDLWGAELDFSAIAKLSREATASKQFKPVPEFPSIQRDFALLVKSDVTADRITQLAMKAGRPLAKVVKIFDVYRGSQVAEGMTSVAVRVIFYEDNRSLQESEAEVASAQILAIWQKELAAELRG